MLADQRSARGGWSSLAGAHHHTGGAVAVQADVRHHDVDETLPPVGVAIEFTPLGLRGMFGVLARALWNTSCEFADVVGIAAFELWERVQGAASWPERFAVCDAVLGRLAGDHPVDPQISRAWERSVSTPLPGASDGPGSISGSVSGMNSV